MTKRLYYEDSYLREFQAAVVTLRQRGKEPAVILDRTAFYPTSGGQPHDEGSMGSSRVLDVEEDSAGEILHVLDKPLPLGSVQASIDWNRRFDHMQQHTGQHILSQAFLKTANAATISFHMGQETSTIDIALPSPPPALLDEAAKLANAVVFEDRRVNILTLERDQLSAFGVRKESDREGPIRVIDVQGFDRSPCGGTHVSRSGEIGIIFILGCENYKGGARVEFVCGERARKAFGKDHGILRDLGQIYSCQPEDLPRLSEKTMQERSALARENLHLQDQLLEIEAVELLGNSTPGLAAQTVIKSYAGRNLESLKVLARKLTARPGVLAVLATVSGQTAQIVVSRSEGVPFDCGAAIKKVAAGMGGKGGGKPDQAQAGGVPTEKLQAWMQEVLKVPGT